MSSTSSVSTFNGTSSYASDLQQVITRAVSIASMPLSQAQNRLYDFEDQQSALSTLNSDFTSLQNAVASLQSALGDSSYSATTSDSSAATVSLGSGAMAGTYTIDATSIGAYSTSVSQDSLPAVSDPYSTSISTSLDYTLTVNGQTYDIKPSGSSLMALAQAINAASDGVQASIVNTGSSSSPSYRMVLSETNLGADTTLQLNDGTQDLLDSLSVGSDASYTVNGLGSAIQSTSRSITVAPGVTVNLLANAVNAQVTVTVSQTTSQLSSAISTFVTAYNQAMSDLSQQVGQNGGALAGESIVQELHRALSQITQYSTTGSSNAVNSLADMGITVDNQGQLSFDSSELDSDSLAALSTFLGTSTSSGFLENATSVLNSVEDSTQGILTVDIQQIEDAITNQNDIISTLDTRITNLQSTLIAQMNAADTLLASLESKKSYMTSLFTEMINAMSNTSGTTSA
jgi:flagellar hook-associated protein 2